jgi:hypothetical protein
MNELEKVRILKDAVDVPRVNFVRLSEITDCSVSSLRAYRSGYRIPSDASVQSMAAGIKAHAALLLNVASRLEGIHG